MWGSWNTCGTESSTTSSTTRSSSPRATPYTSIIGDIPKFCFFSKAALAALNYMDWIPDVIHCHDWQAALVPVYLRTLFQNTPLSRAKSMLTIHNLRFQGVLQHPHHPLLVRPAELCVQ